MSMFCYQCQEASKGVGCSIKGVCGKDEQIAQLQDVLLYAAKGVAYISEIAKKSDINTSAADKFIIDAMFITITNANFDGKKIASKIAEGIKLRDQLKSEVILKGID